MNNNNQYNNFFEKRERNKHSRNVHGKNFFSQFQNLYNQMNIVIINRVAWMIKKQMKQMNNKPVLSEILKYIAERRSMIAFIHDYLDEKNNKINLDYVNLVTDGDVKIMPPAYNSENGKQRIVELLQNKDPIITDFYDLYLYVLGCKNKNLTKIYFDLDKSFGVVRGESMNKYGIPITKYSNYPLTSSLELRPLYYKFLIEKLNMENFFTEIKANTEIKENAITNFNYLFSNTSYHTYFYQAQSLGEQLINEYEKQHNNPESNKIKSFFDKVRRKMNAWEKKKVFKGIFQKEWNSNFLIKYDDIMLSEIFCNITDNNDHTIILEYAIDHTKPEQLKNVAIKLEEIYENIIKSTDDSEKYIGKLYWLLCHACIYQRGSAAITEILNKGLRIALNLHPIIRYAPKQMKIPIIFNNLFNNGLQIVGKEVKEHISLNDSEKNNEENNFSGKNFQRLFNEENNEYTIHMETWPDLEAILFQKVILSSIEKSKYYQNKFYIEQDVDAFATECYPTLWHFGTSLEMESSHIETVILKRQKKVIADLKTKYNSTVNVSGRNTK